MPLRRKKKKKEKNQTDNYKYFMSILRRLYEGCKQAFWNKREILKLLYRYN